MPAATFQKELVKMIKILKGDLIEIISPIKSLQKNITYLRKGDVGIAISSYPSAEGVSSNVSVLFSGKVWGIPASSVKVCVSLVPSE